MGERSGIRRQFSASSRSKFIKKDKEGVASVIGTIMALLVFLTFLTMFTNTYIPVWMKENERSHMDQVLTQFGDMKGKVDSLIVNAQVTGKPTINMYQPFTLGSDGVPVFASATAGYLFLKPQGNYDTGVNQSFWYQLGEGSVLKFNDSGGGSLEFYGPNRYYVQQWYTFENGALLIYQEQGMVMRATPSLTFVTNSDGGINVQFDQVDLIGENTVVSGLGNAGAVIDLIYHDSQTYDLCQSTGVDNGDMTLVFTTRYNYTWTNFINETATAAGLIEGLNYTLTQVVKVDEYRPIYEITLTIMNVDHFTHNRAYIVIELEN